MILDIHTHRPAPYPDGVISLTNLAQPLAEGQLYSAGIHPWDTASPILQEDFVQLEQLAESSRIVAIGECGIDLTKGGPLFRQLQILRKQVEISERIGKPLVLHCVKAVDIILGLKRDLNPTQPWAIHGFRGRPETARQLTDKGIFLSFGEKFNSNTVAEMPSGLILAETDDSILTIEEIIGSLNQAADRDLTPDVASNTASFLSSSLIL